MEAENQSQGKTLEQFSLESVETKTKVIALVNYSRRRQSNEPIRTRSKYMYSAKRGKTFIVAVIKFEFPFLRETLEPPVCFCDKRGRKSFVQKSLLNKRFALLDRRNLQHQRYYSFTLFLENSFYFTSAFIL